MAWGVRREGYGVEKVYQKRGGGEEREEGRKGGREQGRCAPVTAVRAQFFP